MGRNHPMNTSHSSATARIVHSMNTTVDAGGGIEEAGETGVVQTPKIPGHLCETNSAVEEGKPAVLRARVQPANRGLSPCPWQDIHPVAGRGILEAGLPCLPRQS